MSCIVASESYARCQKWQNFIVIKLLHNIKLGITFRTYNVFTAMISNIQSSKWYYIYDSRRNILYCRKVVNNTNCIYVFHFPGEFDTKGNFKKGDFEIQKVPNGTPYTPVRRYDGTWSLPHDRQNLKSRMISMMNSAFSVFIFINISNTIEFKWS